MQTRITMQEINPTLFDGMARIEKYTRSILDPKLIELMKYRVSQINRCAYCLDMHHKEAIHRGEEELRLHTLPAWRECPFYSDAEKAALEFSEVLTETSIPGLPDEIYDNLARYFNKEEIVALTAVVVHINSWNRINHVSRPEPGKYRIGQFENY